MDQGNRIHTTSNSKSSHKVETDVSPSKDKKSGDEKPKEPLQVDNVENFLTFLEAAGETIRPANIEFYNDGSHKVTAWNIGKSIDELYNEKLEEIEKVVALFKQKCYGNLNDEGLGALALDMKKIIRLFKDEGHVIFKDNPDYQKRIKEQFDKAVMRLEGFLHDVVIPTIEYRSSKGGLIGAENNIELSNIEKKEGEVDPYVIKYSTDNSIEFKSEKISFPFDCFHLANQITKLRETLLDRTICATDLQSYPELIFDREEFAGHYNLAGWIYNIIETWITEFEVKIHNNEKARLFTSFLNICMQKALAWKVLGRQVNEDIDENINKETENSSNQNNLNLSNIINQFDKLNIKEVYKHFHEGLVAKKYLTEQELLKYLRAAFEFEIVPENLFKIKNAPTKKKIYEVFYTYYINVAGKPYGKQKRYAALLGNYFEGYNTETVSSNFSKAVY